MDKIAFTLEESGEQVEFFVLEQTTIGGVDYLLVTDEESGDSDAYILKDKSGKGEEEAIYEMVEDDGELEHISRLFEEMLEDINIER